MQAVGNQIVHGSVRDTGMASTVDGHKQSLGAGSGTLTYSTLANVPKAKRQKLIAEARPMVSSACFFNSSQ